MIYPKKLLAVLPLRRQKARCFGLLPIAAAWAAEGQADGPLQTAWCRSGPRCKRCTARLRRSARAGSGSRLSVSAPSAGRCGGLWWRGLLRREDCRPPSRKILPGAAAAGPSGPDTSSHPRRCTQSRRRTLSRPFIFAFAFADAKNFDRRSPRPARGDRHLSLRACRSRQRRQGTKRSVVFLKKAALPLF